MLSRYCARLQCVEIPGLLLFLLVPQSLGEAIETVAFSPDSRLLAVGGHDRTVHVFRCREGAGEEAPDFQVHRLPGAHQDSGS